MKEARREGLPGAWLDVAGLRTVTETPSSASNTLIMKHTLFAVPALLAAAAAFAQVPPANMPPQERTMPRDPSNHVRPAQPEGQVWMRHQGMRPGQPGQPGQPGEMVRPAERGHPEITRDDFLKHQAQRFERMDANKDGKLTIDELHSAREAAQDRRGQHQQNQQHRGERSQAR